MSDLPKSLYDESGRPIRRGRFEKNLLFRLFVIFLFFVVAGVVGFFLIGKNDFSNIGVFAINFDIVFFMFLILFIVIKGYFNLKYLDKNKNENQDDKENFDGEFDDEFELKSVNDEEFEKDVEQFKRDNADLLDDLDEKNK